MKPSALIVAAGVVTIGIVATLLVVRTFSTSGDAALQAMNAEERIYVETLHQIRRDMTPDEVVALLGEPDRLGAGIRPTWRIQNSPLSQVAVYFDDRGARKVRWMSFGRFVYEIEPR